MFSLFLLGCLPPVEGDYDEGIAEESQPATLSDADADADTDSDADADADSDADADTNADADTDADADADPAASSCPTDSEEPSSVANPQVDVRSADSLHVGEGDVDAFTWSVAPLENLQVTVSRPTFANRGIEAELFSPNGSLVDSGQGLGNIQLHGDSGASAYMLRVESAAADDACAMYHLDAEITCLSEPTESDIPTMLTAGASEVTVTGRGDSDAFIFEVPTLGWAEVRLDVDDALVYTNLCKPHLWGGATG